MQNAECKIFDIRFANDLNMSRKDTSIMHYAFCILH